MQKTRAAGLLHLLYDIEIMWRKIKKTLFFYVLYCDKKRVFDQSERAQAAICIDTFIRK